MSKPLKTHPIVWFVMAFVIFGMSGATKDPAAGAGYCAMVAGLVYLTVRMARWKRRENSEILWAWATVFTGAVSPIILLILPKKRQVVEAEFEVIDLTEPAEEVPPITRAEMITGNIKPEATARLWGNKN